MCRGEDMNQIISSVSRIAFVLTTEPFWTRSWCLWELVCAHGVGAEVKIYDQIMRIKKKYWSSEAHLVPPKFRSVADLSATKASDQQQILDALVRTFGSVRRANEHIRKILPDY